MDGLILIDKPPGCTSHDVVHTLRRILHEKKIGHFGTLDPMAEGLLLIGTGKATRLFPFLSRTRKTYEGRIRLGLTTDTYDREGKITARHGGALPDREAVEKAMAEFLGDILQAPPPYSAKKYMGKPLYVRARQNKPVHLEPVPVTVFSFEMTEFAPPAVGFRTACSSGTYIRSLAHDLGSRLGCGASLDSLRRTSVGIYAVAEARSPDEIRRLAEEGRIDDFLRPLESLLSDFPALRLDEAEARSIRHGNPIPMENRPGLLPVQDRDEGVVRLFDREGRLIALARPDTEGKALHPFLVFAAD
jgi:tRNA pseudouridine55 synthase